jgi:hypothetical protein
MDTNEPATAAVDSLTLCVGVLNREVLARFDACVCVCVCVCVCMCVIYLHIYIHVCVCMCHAMRIPACAHLPHILILIVTVCRRPPRHYAPPNASIRRRHASSRRPRCLFTCASRVAVPRLFMRGGQRQLAIRISIGVAGPGAMRSVRSCKRPAACCRSSTCAAGVFDASVSFDRASAAWGGRRQRSRGLQRRRRVDVC